MKLYKLTDRNGCTYGGCLWGEGIEHTASGEGGLCGPGWLHAYTHPLLAVVFNPIYGHIEDPLLWEAEGDVGATDHGLKVGCTRLRTVQQIPLPEVTPEQRVRFAILCARSVCNNAAWLAWANAWLDGTDRSEESASAIARALWAQSWTAEAGVMWTAEAAMSAAYSAAWVGTQAAALSVARAAWTAASWTKVDLMSMAMEAIEAGGDNAA